MVKTCQRTSSKIFITKTLPRNATPLTKLGGKMFITITLGGAKATTRLLIFWPITKQINDI
jgi:hypothetical protein